MPAKKITKAKPANAKTRSTAKGGSAKVKKPRKATAGEPESVEPIQQAPEPEPTGVEPVPQVPETEPTSVEPAPAASAADSIAIEPPEEPGLAEQAKIEPAAEAPAPVEATPASVQPTKVNSNKLSAIDAAARVLAEARKPMNCQEMIGVMAMKGYWSSPAGRTPAATLYSSILREIKVRGDQARFRKTERGKFMHTGA